MRLYVGALWHSFNWPPQDFSQDFLGIFWLLEIRFLLMQVLGYVRSLCEALETDFRLYSTRSHRESVRREINMDYHNRCLQGIADGSYDFGYAYEIEEGKKY